jgi:hypothetical protein
MVGPESHRAFRSLRLASGSWHCFPSLAHLVGAGEQRVHSLRSPVSYLWQQFARSNTHLSFFARHSLQAGIFFSSGIWLPASVNSNGGPLHVSAQKVENVRIRPKDHFIKHSSRVMQCFYCFDHPDHCLLACLEGVSEPS